ncbi:hypothetical protein QLL95_gp0557 [Cotonvirus japonicus]|uniref:Uncharacterized protein n=1 Tax=Cotonvirus japonicus TaxID=2811091 RepID=A0ABM7NTY7_9VIRU|nr:hypothetical protein QLL95_gp0557 [Cotonvirus japonicus]BCS83566.1 hypothetical protein [Cotonvirus japonicus]
MRDWDRNPMYFPADTKLTGIWDNSMELPSSCTKLDSNMESIYNTELTIDDKIIKNFMSKLQSDKYKYKNKKEAEHIINELKEFIDKNKTTIKNPNKLESDNISKIITGKWLVIWYS